MKSGIVALVEAWPSFSSCTGSEVARAVAGDSNWNTKAALLDVVQLHRAPAAAHPALPGRALAKRCVHSIPQCSSRASRISN